MGSVFIGNIYGYADNNTKHGYFKAYFDYDSITRSGTTITIKNGRIKCVGSSSVGFTTNTITISEVVIGKTTLIASQSFIGQTYWNTTWTSNKVTVDIKDVGGGIGSLTVSANWQRTGGSKRALRGAVTIPTAKLTINYHVNGGSISSTTYSAKSSIVYRNNGTDKVYTPGDYGGVLNLYDDTTFGLTRTGYVFGGWQTTSTGGTVFDKTSDHAVSAFANNMTRDKTITLYAKWKANTLSISFNAAGGTITQQTGSNKWSLDANGNILLNGVLYTQNYTYGSSGSSNGLPDGDNASHIKLIPPAKYTFLYGDPKTIDGVLYNTGYWNSLKSGKGVSLDWHTAYTTADICELLNISLNDGSKSITLYIMWTLAGNIYVNVNGTFKPGILYAKVNNVWRVVDTIYTKDSTGKYRASTL